MAGEGSISYAIELLRILLRLYHEAYIMFPCYEQSQSELQHSPGKESPLLLPPFFFSQAGNTEESDLSQTTS